MLNNYSNTDRYNFVGSGLLDDTFAAVIRRVYVWMALGLFTTAGVSALIANSPLFPILAGQPIIFFGLLILELALVIGLTWGINRISAATAMALFFAYSVLNGVTLSVLFAVYTLGSVAYTFLASAALFGVMSVIGYTTKINLAKMGTYLLMGLIGLIIAMVVSMFWANSGLGWVITFVGILLFLGLTVYDTQRIKRMTAVALQQGNEDIEARLGILGALSLYLDFVNLFLFMLRLGGRRR
jgi:FtsH-binding integral membrane protein